MDNDNCITVTHFINPHLFWYKNIEAPNSQFQVLHLLEENLLQLYKNKPSCDNSLRPQLGDKVAVNFIAWNKYIRAEILKVEYQQEQYIVWALDYGFPMLTKKEYLRNLPNNLQIDIGLVQLGGVVNVYPAEQEYDDMEGNLVMVKQDIWSQRCCDMLEKLLADAISVSFNKCYASENGHIWGNLIILNHKGTKINARDYLLKTTNAIDENDLIFKEIYPKLKTTKIAKWLTNDRKYKTKTNNIKHNYIEHSKQMSAILIDQNAKRKVEDWQERNERKQNEAVNDTAEPIFEKSEEAVDDVTFDDSVSVISSKQVNRIGKVGILTKIKQQKYSSDKDIPPLALPKSFEIDEMLAGLDCPKELQDILSLCSGSKYSPHIEKPPQTHFNKEVSKEINEEKPIATSNLINIYNQTGLTELESTASSKTSSIRQRQQKLNEMRKKLAHDEKQKKMNETEVLKSMCNQNEPTNSTISQPKTSDYTSIKMTQDNKSELSVQNVRIKHLIAMRKKFGSTTPSSSNDNGQVNTTEESQFSTTNTQSKQECKNKTDMKSLNTSNFQLKPKIISKPDNEIIDRLNKISSVTLTSKNTVKENLKLSQTGYDNFTMVPAGYDITRLQTYNNEETHWHRKKSTRYDYIPHNQTSSTDELLSNNTNDNSFSSSDFFQIEPINKRLSQRNQLNPFTSSSHSNVTQETESNFSSQQHDNSSIQLKIKNPGGIKSSNELSTSSNSPVLSYKLRKRRQLKSPTSQILKIDQILQEHRIEKDYGNTNILDLKLLNNSSCSQKSLLSSTSSNISPDNKKVAIIDKNSNINDSSQSSSLDNIRHNKVGKEVFNCEAVMDIKRTEYLPIVEGEHNIQTKFIEHLVLAHSSIQLMPIENISEAPFLPEIHEEMQQMRVKKVYRIQVYSWSHVLRNNSLFVVNPSRSGKTWSYLPALCSLICCRKDAFKSSYGPVAVILVASLKHVELVNNYCRRLMSGFKAEAPTCIPSYGMRNLIETKINLLNGCGILVATPSNLLRLLRENENEPLFDAERLQHIVIDDMDIMMSRSQEDFEKAYITLFKIARKSNLKKLSPQLIVTSRDWDGLMVEFIRKSNQPLLLIGDFLEAAVYGHATLSVKLKSNAEKKETVFKFIKKISESAQSLDNRTLIMCNDDEDVESVRKFLLDCGYPCLGYYSRSTESERITIEEWKNKVSFQILVCTDARFHELKIQNVNNLIHYSMPTSWTQFTLRFSAFARTYNNYVCVFENKTLPSTNTAKKYYAHSMILLDEYNNLQLPRLVDFLRKHNQIVQNEIKAVSKQVLIEHRISKTSLLCPQLLEFGECDETRCDSRHELTRFDVIKKRDDIPCSGEMRIHVLKVFSPTYYAVRLLYHKPPNTKKWIETRRSSEALTFSIQLNMHYHNDNNLFLHWPPHIDDLCIYQYAGNFRRAHILDAPTFQQNGTNVVQSNLKVTLRLIDDGIIINSVKCNEIFVCKDTFKDFPPQAVDVRLMKVVPFDNERSWDSKTTKQVQKWIVEDIKPNYIVQANIDFSLTHTIWVKNVMVWEKLAGINAYYPVVDLKKTLVKKNFGVIYNGDRKHVRDLAEEYGLLNTTGFDDGTGDSEFDYQSCKNESINLINFSSDESKNSSLKSAETSLEQHRKIEDISFDLEAAKKETNSAVVNVETSLQEEDWDKNLESGQQLDELYVPIETKTFNKNTNLMNESNIRILPKEDTWSKLNINEPVKVEIGDEGENGNWENIFLQVIDKKSIHLFTELNNLIVTHIEKMKSNNENFPKIYDFQPFYNCIVKYNNLYLRAKVYGVYGENIQERLYRFFLCDYACFTNVKAEELYNDFLYETTTEIVTFTPYQAIHCTLAGIKWDRFTKRYQVTKDYLYACAVLENDCKKKIGSNLQNLNIQSYSILLYECEKENEFSNALLFNKALVDNCITMYDEETKNFLEYEIGMQENEESEASNTENNNIEETIEVPKTYNRDEVLTYEQLIDFIKSESLDIEFNDMITDVKDSETKSLQYDANKIESPNIISKSEKNNIVMTKISKKEEISKMQKEKLKKVQNSDREIDGQNHCSRFSSSGMKSSTSANISNSSEPESSLPAAASLKSLYKRPVTTWYQNDWMIFISVYAPDVKDYFLEVTSKTILFAADLQCEKNVLILNLLGSIDTKTVSHEIKGLNVIIRLKKIVFLKWQRLLKESTKYFWLKYNFNAFDSIEMEYIMPQQLLYTVLDNELNVADQHSDNYNSDDDDEHELYQTYNPIQTNDEDYDPFSAF